MIWDGIERRRFVRVAFSFPAGISVDKQTMISACAEEISEGGIKVTTAEGVQASTIVDLEIHLGEKPITCKGKIVRVRKIESKHLKHGIVYDIGIEFKDMKEKDKETVRSVVAAKKREKML